MMQPLSALLFGRHRTFCPLPCEAVSRQEQGWSAAPARPLGSSGNSQGLVVRGSPGAERNMNGSTAVANSTPLERDARLVNADERPVAPSEIAIGVIIGRTSEFFDFFVYAIASVLVFPSLMFPNVDALTGTLYSFALFALAFLARPVGSLIFMEIDRRYGRGVKLTIALFLLGGSTMMIAFLPGYDAIGIAAPLLLALFRMGQGTALGGAWDGLPSLLNLNAPPDRRGWYAMIPQLGAPARPARGLGPVRVLPLDPVVRGLPVLGLALPVLRRLRDQRRGAVRPAAAGRDARVRPPVRKPRAAALARGRDAAQCTAAPSSSAPSPRSRASRCSTSSRCSRCPGSCCSRPTR